MKHLLVIDVPGLSLGQLGESAPVMSALSHRARLRPVFPAVTMPAHAAMVTGQMPQESGVVANGWFVREHNEVMMWRQSERLMSGTRVWETGRERFSEFTCLKHFWWPGMASSADWTVNVRPVYFADGRKLGDVYCNDPALADAMRERFGPFPLFQFWGPGTSLKSSEWIADSAMWFMEEKRPTLALVYLPHLDYNQQRYGPNHPCVTHDLRDIDAVVSGMLESANRLGYEVLIVSDYQITEVDQPIHLNRYLRERGWLRIINNTVGELIDYGTSAAFAVSDHQTAQIYVADDALIPEVAAFVSDLAGVDRVWTGAARAEVGLNHERAGDVVVAAKPRSWFTYYYWLDDADAPDFARTVAIHAKPGYDPCEMLIDPAIRCPKLRVAMKVIAKKLGMRTLFDFCPLDASLVRGSHGLLPKQPDDFPVLLSTSALEKEQYDATDLPELMLSLIGGRPGS